MDSGNSGSMQSSSTGGGEDQEFESTHGSGGRDDPSSSSMSAFFNPSAMPMPMSMPHMPMPMPGFDNTVPFQLYSLPNNASSFHNFDLPTFSQSSPFMITNNTNLNNNINNNNSITNTNNDNGVGMVWPNKFGSMKQSVSISSSSYLNDVNCTTGVTSNFTHNTPQQQQQFNPVAVQANRVQPASGEHSPRSSDQPGSRPARNPKKRSRATRKAPTTVLTTDTSNFRQMVQEFTGIPAPPFSAFPGRTRLDVFSGLGIQLARAGAGPGAGLGLGLGASQMSNVLRPFPQKLVAQPIPVHAQSSLSSMSDSIGTISTTTPANPVNPMLTFQSLLQQQSPLSSLEKYSLPDYHQGSVSSLGPKATDSLLNQFALGHATTAATTTAAATTMAHVTSTMGSGNTALVQQNRQGVCSVGEEGEGSYKVNGMTGNVAPTDVHQGSGARCEGTLESWICSTDH